MIELRHVMLSEPIIIKKEILTNVVFETSNHFYVFLKDINDAYAGNTENIDFIQNEKEYNFRTKAIFISDIISYEINSRKVKNELLKSISELADDDFQKEIENINKQLLELINNKITLWGDIYFRDEIPIIDYLKLFEFEVNDVDKSLIEKIMIWIKSFIDLYQIDFYVFVNLFDFLNKEEIEILNSFCQQEKISILVVTRHNYSELTAFIHQYIVDKDTYLIHRSV
ncbi:MAG TPA: type II-A CRISPR-associated protein Csn2 [Candidatus Paceibacterota bacterium]|jgi:CRISPR type II-A-associated protein Csn2|nr:MAG: CRISPR-associated protein (Cas_Csn2) [Tenericutes bacterium ADurb.Bin024]HOE15627.1 type II-A CRISPR-associated protein Csn2 [Candidatus Paceibacterota bacterium]HOM32357.1 type II-A CRISPR-associated protein Csn2 [Bacilli bacterium]